MLESHFALLAAYRYFIIGCLSLFSRLLKYSESSYTALPHIKLLEDHGKRGDRILMKGLQTGAAIISVKAADPAYKVRLDRIWLSFSLSFNSTLIVS